MPFVEKNSKTIGVTVSHFSAISSAIYWALYGETKTRGIRMPIITKCQCVPALHMWYSVVAEVYLEKPTRSKG